MTTPSPSWLMRAQPRPEARLRLFCLPSAGYGAAMYRGWAASLPPAIDVCAVSLPGREALLRLEPVPNLLQLVDRLAMQIAAHLDRPYAIFGHSYGAWLAFETTRALRRGGKPLPAHLFVSGRRAPHQKSAERPMHGLDDAALIKEIQRRYGGIPAAVLQEPELLALLVPALRADLAALETYEYREEAPLECPMSSYGGAADPLVPRADLEAWRLHALGSFEVRHFPGAHFYLQDLSRAAVLTAIGEQLSAADVS